VLRIGTTTVGGGSMAEIVMEQVLAVSV